MKAMKIKTYILAALMLLSVNILSAKGIVSANTDGYETAAIPLSLLTSLAPETPKEATFEDLSPFETVLLLESLAPGTPVEAEFEDPASDLLSHILKLAPGLPKEADFNDQFLICK